jgi:tetratricopeptide (TPR) repeat protein
MAAAGPSTAVKAALIALVGAGIAWRIVTLGVADQHFQERKDAAAALEWDAYHPGANLMLGARERAVDPEAALARLQAAVAANPGEGRSYATLGLLYEARGDAMRAEQAMDIASRLSPQRTDVQMLVGAYWMRRGDVGRALTHWDTVLRYQGGMRTQVFPELLKLASHPAHHAAFMTLLDEPVAWWPAFFAHAAAKAPDLNTVRVLFNLQLGGPNTPTAEMLRAYLARLQKEGRWLEAWFVWLNSLPKEQIRQTGYLHNGSFESVPTDLGFDWIRQKHPAVRLDTAGTYDTSGDKALRVSFRGQRVQFQHLHQYLMLPPGPYRLYGRVRPDNLQAQHGMQWALYCLGIKEPTAVSPRFRGSEQWTRFRTEFDVPAEACPVQMLRLELAGSVRLDYDATGTIWFDSLAIERVR